MEARSSLVGTVTSLSMTVNAPAALDGSELRSTTRSLESDLGVKPPLLFRLPRVAQVQELSNSERMIKSVSPAHKLGTAIR